MTPTTNAKETTAIDVELAGDVLRVGLGGLPELASANAIDALAELRSQHEAFRDFLNLPPHGNPLINSCLVYPPFEKTAHGALFLASRFAYAPYAGTALMAAATALAEMRGFEPVPDPRLFSFETARGLMTVELNHSKSATTQAKWFAPRPEVLVSNQKLQLMSNTSVPVFLVNAGLPYLVVDAGGMGLSLGDHSGLKGAAIHLSSAAHKSFPLSHFGIEEDYGRCLVMFFSQVADNHVETVWVSDKGEIANSVGGTGALAVLAACENGGVTRPGALTRIQAPGGAFECQLADGQATVAAKVQIIAKHQFRWRPNAGF